MTLVHNHNLSIVTAGLVWSLLVLVLYSLLRGYHDMHLLTAIVSVRLAAGIATGLFAGGACLAARLLRIPGSQVNPVKVVTYVTAATVTSLAAYNLLEIWA